MEDEPLSDELSDEEDTTQHFGDELKSLDSSSTLDAPQSSSSGASTTGKRSQTAPAASTQQASESDCESPSSHPSDLTKKYLQLLNAGRLASKKKFDTQYGKPAALQQIGGSRRHTRPETSISVYDADLQRMQASDVTVSPVSLNLTSKPLSRQADERPLEQSPQRSSRLHSTARSQLSASAPAIVFHKILTPGPGAYAPYADRFGNREASKCSFGTARQRPPHVCIMDNVVSPGPAYMPVKDFVSTLSSAPRFRFGQREMGSRFSLNEGQPTNCPHWNPGPADYEAISIYKGGKVEPGSDAPKTVFGKSEKLVSPEARFSATAFISEAHSKLENACVHSPGPSFYKPDGSLTQRAASSYSLAAKGPSYFDVFFDPARQQSPGPIYSTSHIDNKGCKPWGGDPKATFGRARKQWEPEVSLSATTFISKDHAMHANQTVHGPGPIYFPEVCHHVASPILTSGQANRFYDRFEPGRVG